MRNTIVILLLFLVSTSVAQTAKDTINRYDGKKHKTGYWEIFFDANFKECTKDSAHYFAYEYYHKGKSPLKPLGRIHKKDSLVYKPSQNSVSNTLPILLNGELVTYSRNKKEIRLYMSEFYVNGKVTVFKQYHLNSVDNSSETDILYFDSLYKNQLHSGLCYQMYNNIAISKHYFGAGTKSAKREYLVKVKEFKHVYRPIIGYYGLSNPSDESLKAKDFLEIGVSKKFIKGFTADTIGKRYEDNTTAFPALNFSLLGSHTRGNGCLGQKLTFSHTLFCLKGEAGLVNFTDFNQYDLRAIFGIGWEIPCRFTVMVFFSTPLAGRQFKDIGTMSIMIAID